MRHDEACPWSWPLILSGMDLVEEHVIADVRWKERTFAMPKSHDITASANWSYRSPFSLMSAFSVGSLLSFASVLSIGSAGSILSIGSSGSILSIGSTGSILSIGSAGSILGIGKAGFSPRGWKAAE